MAVVISRIVTEVVVAPSSDAGSGSAPGPAPAGGGLSDAAMDAVVRQATERVLEVLRREWDR